ncbi:hypothetical protein AGLY_007582 [Aphis glycines]|uniref:Uncharacterized protein n=1 Tax=Aphis glycines TaxID=307491 RepID=A0A6G0TMV8_APHGL|nr:hypothetical protein AGLY_007582 [Aphis glycines]
MIQSIQYDKFNYLYKITGFNGTKRAPFEVCWDKMMFKNGTYGGLRKIEHSADRYLVAVFRRISGCFFFCVFYLNLWCNYTKANTRLYASKFVKISFNRSRRKLEYEYSILGDISRGDLSAKPDNKSVLKPKNIGFLIRNIKEFKNEICLKTSCLSLVSIMEFVTKGLNESLERVQRRFLRRIGYKPQLLLLVTFFLFCLHSTPLRIFQESLHLECLDIKRQTSYNKVSTRHFPLSGPTLIVLNKRRIFTCHTLRASKITSSTTPLVDGSLENESKADQRMQNRPPPGHVLNTFLGGITIIMILFRSFPLNDVDGKHVHIEIAVVLFAITVAVEFRFGGVLIAQRIQRYRWTRFHDKFLRYTLPITRQNGSVSSLGVTVVVCKTSEGLECGTKFVDFELASVSKITFFININIITLTAFFIRTVQSLLVTPNSDLFCEEKSKMIVPPPNQTFQPSNMI